MKTRPLYSADWRDFVVQPTPRSLLADKPAERLEQLLWLRRLRLISERQLRRLLDVVG